MENQEFSEGDFLGPFRLQKKLGEGGFGQVWKAQRYQSIASTPVALKILNVTKSANRFLENQAFFDETQIWTQIKPHPNVLPLLEAGIYSDVLALVSFFAEGGSLRDFLARNGKKISVEHGIQIMTGIIQGLRHLHEFQILHLDLKPGNILLNGEQPMIGDFGLSKFSGDSSEGVTAGTVEYLSPELMRGNPPNFMDDLWAVSVLGFEMFTGFSPFDFNEQTWVRLRIDERERREFYSKPLYFKDFKNKKLVGFLKKALSYNPSDRFLSADEMLKSFQQIKKTGFTTQLIQNPATHEIFETESYLPARTGATVETLRFSESGESETEILSASPARISNLAVSPNSESSLSLTPTRTAKPFEINGNNEIQKALERLRPNGTLILGPGVYRESILITKPVTIECTGPALETMLQGREQPCVIIQSEGVVINGLTLRLYAHVRHTYALEVRRGNVTLKDCDISADGASCVLVSVQGSNEILFEGCRIHDSARGSGVFVHSGVTSLDQCELFGNHLSGLAVTGKGVAKVVSTVISGNAWKGVSLWEGGQATISKSEVRANGGAGQIVVSDESRLEARECIVSNGEGFGVCLIENGLVELVDCTVDGNRKGPFYDPLRRIIAR